ncbi:MAG: ABC transporter ATP-binding protein [Chloroflexi bacterium]|nr:ABC transporter ATP-binding protein [Chloroflexota bacterium]
MTSDRGVFSTKAEEAKRRVGSGKEVWSRFGKYLKPYRSNLTVGTLAIVGGALTGLVAPYLHAIAINDIISPAAETGSRATLSGFAWWVPLFILVTASNYVFQYLQTYHMRVMGERSVQVLRNDSVAKLQAISLKYFAEGEIGRIMSRPTTDSQQVRIFLRMGLTALISDAAAILGSLVIIFFLNYKLALLATAILPVAALLLWSLGGVSRRQYRVSLANLAGLIAKMQESCSGMRVVKAFVQDEAAARGFDVANAKTVRAWKRTILISTAYLPIMQIMRIIGTVLILWYGTMLYMDGGISLGVLAAFLEYQFSYFIPLTTLLTAFDQYQSGTAALERIFDLLDTHPEVRDPEPDKAVAIDTIDHVQFDDVSFGYDPNEPVLQNINLSLRGSQKLALVGPTGAGKSTTINLLERFYDPDSGTITINGHDVRDIRIDDCRAHMSTVLQDSFLFPMTVRDNIRFGRPQATDDEVVAAAKTVGAHEFIMRLPGGYDYFIQENASNISIGQRQLISFARTLLVDPKLLILDEATSSIDPYTELVLQRALEKLLANRLAIIIAHRLSTIRLCDEILVLDQGRIVEHGSHSELMARDGLYSSFYRMQFREERGLELGAAPEPTA